MESPPLKTHTLEYRKKKSSQFSSLLFASELRQEKKEHAYRFLIRFVLALTGGLINDTQLLLLKGEGLHEYATT
jgi:hypothetical protein